METLFPLKIYFFGEDGKYDPRFDVIECYSEEQLNGPGTKMLVKAHIEKGLEVRITDVEDMCVFRAKDGKIIFPEGVQ